jgi:hypothetical protein
VEQSRDFQLFCRLYDAVINGVRYDIKTIPTLLNPLTMRENLLPLYATKVGFFTNKQINDRVLRYILSAFPIALKHKGTKFGIELAVNAVLKAENSIENAIVNITNKDEYIVDIVTPINIYNKTALQEFLKYIVPAGYKYTISVGIRKDVGDTELDLQNSINHAAYDNEELSLIYKEKEPTKPLERLLGAIDTTIVITGAEENNNG